MKIYGKQNTSLTLTEKAFEVYSTSDPLTIIEQDDGTFSIRGIDERDGLTESDVNEFLESFIDD